MSLDPDAAQDPPANPVAAKQGLALTVQIDPVTEMPVLSPDAPFLAATRALPGDIVYVTVSAVRVVPSNWTNRATAQELWYGPHGVCPPPPGGAE